jgi:hypothetical protein
MDDNAIKSSRDPTIQLAASARFGNPSVRPPTRTVTMCPIAWPRAPGIRQCHCPHITRSSRSKTNEPQLDIRPELRGLGLAIVGA